MKSFNQIYEDVYKSCNNELEVRRSSFKNKTIILFIIFIIIGWLLTTWLSNPSFFIIFLAPPIIITSFSKERRNYNLMFKSNVIKTFIKSYAETLEYIPEAGISPQIYRNGEFERYDRYNSEDYICGTLEGGYKIHMAEVHTEDKSKDKDGRTTYTTIFYGLFAQVEFDKFISQTIKLRKNKLFKVFNQDQRIEMDSGEFEKIYDIYSENKIVAMQLLTADIMQMFIDFKNEHKLTPEITIFSNKLYIRFNTGNTFEANILQHSLDYSTLKKYYDIINFTLDITEKMLKNITETEI